MAIKNDQKSSENFFVKNVTILHHERVNMTAIF